MATLNLERVGRPLATIEGGTLKSKLVCVADENERSKVNHKLKKIARQVQISSCPEHTQRARNHLYLRSIQSGSGNPGNQHLPAIIDTVQEKPHLYIYSVRR